MAGMIKSVAIIEPCGDYGIGGYAYELAEGLAENGVRVDLYTDPSCTLRSVPLPRRHRLLPLLGSFMFRQRGDFPKEPGVLPARPPANTSAGSKRRPTLRSRSKVYGLARQRLLPIELALHLKRSNYDLVWTQWPPIRPYGLEFWTVCRLLGLSVAHTVHNVLPHEPRPGDAAIYEAVYRKCDFLIVHSQCARNSLLAFCPKVDPKVIVAPHGLYTIFPRMPEARGETRNRLGIADNHVALLFYGCVRPYKNIDAVLQALPSPSLGNTVLIVAGREAFYDDLVPGEPLGRTRKRAEELGVSSRLRLIGGTLDLRETAEIFEAADVVLLPYIESYGSGLLLLAMTFGKLIVATRAGGMDEYLASYPQHVLIDRSDSATIAGGIARGMEHMLADREPHGSPRFPQLEWPNIARDILRQISAQCTAVRE